MNTEFPKKDFDDFLNNYGKVGHEQIDISKAGDGSLHLSTKKKASQAWTFLFGIDAKERDHTTRKLLRFFENLKVSNDPADIIAEIKVLNCLAQAFPQEKKAFGNFAEKLLVRLPNDELTKLAIKYLQASPPNLTLAVSLFEKAADKGHPEALHQLGLCYLHGIVVKENPEHAFKLFTSAAKESPEAMNQLGRCYELGIGTKRDLEAAFKCYEIASKSNMDALIRLGSCYERGVGTEQEMTKAKECYEQAHKAGNIHAACHLSRCIREQMGSDIHEQAVALTNAENLVKDLAKEGHAEAQFEYGNVLLASSTGKALYLIRDQSELQRILLYFEQAAQQGYAPAQHECAKLYQAQGKKSKANEWFKKAAIQGYEPAVSALLTQKPSPGLITIYKKAVASGSSIAQLELVKYFYKQADLSTIEDSFKAFHKLSEEAQTLALKFYDSQDTQKGLSSNLQAVQKCREGLRYEHGIGVKKNPERALELYQKALEIAPKDPSALYYRGMWHYHHGTSSDALAEALADFVSIINQKGQNSHLLSQALLHAGYIYEKNGKGGQAFICFDNALRTPNLPSHVRAETIYRIALLYEEGKEIPKKLGAAYNYFKAAAEKGHLLAQRKLGEWYLKGFGSVQKDIETGLRYYKEAAAQGDTSAVISIIEHYLANDDLVSAKTYYEQIKHTEEGKKWASSWKNKGENFLLSPPTETREEQIS